METAVNNKLPFVGLLIIKTINYLNTCFHRKRTNKGFLLHYQSHIVDRANCQSSTPDLFTQEYRHLKTIFWNWNIQSEKLINTTFKSFLSSRDQNQNLPFKDQKSSNYIHKELPHLGNKINHPIQPVFVSKKIAEDVKFTETKPSLVNQQSVVYDFKCNLSNANYIGYTSCHLHLHIEEHKYSVIAQSAIYP